MSKGVGQERRTSGGRGVQPVDLPGVVMAQAAKRRAFACNFRPKLESEERDGCRCRKVTLLLAFPCRDSGELLAKWSRQPKASPRGEATHLQPGLRPLP